MSVIDIKLAESDLKNRITENGTHKVFVIENLSNVGDFTPFYIAIAICSVILGFLLILNIVCCRSRHSDYWLDRHTGNRWIISIWTTTPHKQPPLDITEIESQYQPVQYIHPYPNEQYQEVKNHEFEVSPSYSQQPLTSSRHYYTMHKRESEL